MIVSRSVAQSLFPNQDALNRHVAWTDPMARFVDISPAPGRIVGIAADIDDENVVAGPAMTLYVPLGQGPLWAGRLFVHAGGDPHALVNPITRAIRELSADQPVERAATLEDVRAEVLSPDRLNALVFGGFAVVALAIAVVGVAGVLAFSVSGRTREFGIRMAAGARPRQILGRVVSEGVMMASGGIAAGLAAGYALEEFAGSYIGLQAAGGWVVVAPAAVLMLAAVIASAVPGTHAARVDVVQSLRAE